MPQQITFERLNGGDDLSECKAIRHVVFIDEQQVPQQEEWDGLDYKFTHYIIRENGKAVGTCRVNICDNGIAKLARFCLLKEVRGKGYALQFLEFIISDMKLDRRLQKIKISAQTYALGFYEKVGFKAYGDEYLDCNIKHFDMVLNII